MLIFFKSSFPVSELTAQKILHFFNLQRASANQHESLQPQTVFFSIIFHTPLRKIIESNSSNLFSSQQSDYFKHQFMQTTRYSMFLQDVKISIK